jgi:hypothetical protein
MSETVIVVLVTAAAPTLVAIAALIVNYRGFALIDARFASFQNSMDSGFASLEHAFDNIHGDSKG